MGKNEKTPITINGVEYHYEDLTQEQQVLFNHCVDLDRKMDSAKFNLDQLAVGKDAFIKMLEESLKKPKENEDADPLEPCAVTPSPFPQHI
jgi:hypothetical protein